MYRNLLTITTYWKFHLRIMIEVLIKRTPTTISVFLSHRLFTPKHLKIDPEMFHLLGQWYNRQRSKRIIRNLKDKIMYRANKLNKLILFLVNHIIRLKYSLTMINKIIMEFLMIKVMKTQKILE